MVKVKKKKEKNIYYYYFFFFSQYCLFWLSLCHFSLNVFASAPCCCCCFFFFLMYTFIHWWQHPAAVNADSDNKRDFSWLFQDNVLQFFAKSFSSSPLSVTREIYTSLGRPFGTASRASTLSKCLQCQHSSCLCFLFTRLSCKNLRCPAV